jgi:hypothetical protein
MDERYRDNGPDDSHERVDGTVSGDDRSTHGTDPCGAANLNLALGEADEIHDELPSW